MKRLVIDPSGVGHVVGQTGAPTRVSRALASRIAEAVSGDTRTDGELERYLSAGGSRSWTVRHVPAGPVLQRLQIELSSRCNLACDYCFSSRGPLDSRALDRATADRVLYEADELGTVQVTITGGEPLVVPYWREYVAQARERGLSVTMQTNATLIGSAEADYLARHQVAVHVSFDSHLAELHDARRGADGSLDLALRGTDLLYDRHVPLKVSVMATSDNFATLVESVQFFSRRYARAVVNIDRVVPLRDDTNVTYLSEEDFWVAIQPYLSQQTRPGRICGDANGYGYGEPECGVGYSLAHLTSDGELAGCPTLTSRVSEDVAGVSIHERTLADAWLSGEALGGLLQANCGVAAHCESGKNCGGGCRSNAYLATGRVDAPDQFECNLRRNGGKTWVNFLGRYDRDVFSPVDV